MEILGIIWNEGIMRPMINSLAVFYWLLFNNFGLAIIVFTVLVRAAMIPLTMRQTRQMKKMQGLTPRMKAIQEKYREKKDPDSRRAQSSETLSLYRRRRRRVLRICRTRSMRGTRRMRWCRWTASFWASTLRMRYLRSTFR